MWRANAEVKGGDRNPAIIVGGAGNWNAGSYKLLPVQRFKVYTGGVTGYVDVRDVAKIASLWWRKRNRRTAICLCSENISYKDFLTSIARTMQVERPDGACGRIFIGDGVAYGRDEIHVHRQRTYGHRWQTATIANKRWQFDNTKIRALGYDFIPLQQSIFRNSGSI